MRLSACVALLALCVPLRCEAITKDFDTPQTTSDAYIPLVQVPRMTMEDIRIPAAESFGIAAGGVMTVELELHQPTDINNTFFMILTSEQLSRFRSSTPHVLPSFTSPEARVVNTNFMAYWRQPLMSKISMTKTVEWLDRYTLIIVNGDEQDLRFTGKIRLVNPGKDDEQHLSFDQIPMMPVLLTMIWVYLISTALLFLLLVTGWRRRKTAIHWIMLATLLSKSLYLVFYWQNFVLFSSKGSLERFQRKIPRIVGKMQDIISLMMYLLVALGWKILRSNLSMTEVRFSAGICVISFYLGLFQVTCQGPTCSGYELSRYILHALAYLCIIVAINFNIAMLNGSITESAVSLSTAELYQKFDAYRLYRWVFVIYIMKPTFLLFFKLSVLDANGWDDWLYLLMQNLVEFGIYATIIWAYRPFEPMRVFKDLLTTESSEGDEEEDEEEEPEDDADAPLPPPAPSQPSSNNAPAAAALPASQSRNPQSTDIITPV